MVAKLSVNDEAQLAPLTKLSAEAETLKLTAKSPKTVGENNPIASLKGSTKQAPSLTKENLHLLLKKATQECVSRDLAQGDMYLNELVQLVECPKPIKRSKDSVTAMNQHPEIKDTLLSTESCSPSLMSHSGNEMRNDPEILVDSTEPSTANITED